MKPLSPFPRPPRPPMHKFPDYSLRARDTLTPYEQNALREIMDWKSPGVSRLTGFMKVINKPTEKVADLVMDAPGVGLIIDKTFSGLVGLLSGAASWSVGTSSVLADYQKHGFQNISDLGDIAPLSLQDVERVLGSPAAKYKALAVAEGAALGVLGAVSIPADIVAVISLSLRAIGEYAAYYGFDPAAQSERLFAVNILSLISSPTDNGRHAALGRLIKISKSVAKRRAWKNIEQSVFTSIVERIARALGVRLTRAKLAQFLPVAGAVVDSGFNILYTGKICVAAKQLYRERFLARQFGEDIIPSTDIGDDNIALDDMAE